MYMKSIFFNRRSSLIYLSIAVIVLCGFVMYAGNVVGNDKVVSHEFDLAGSVMYADAGDMASSSVSGSNLELKQIPLTYEERIACQETIERVYWKHRIWPKENPIPKPAFESMVDRTVITKKVNDTLQKTNAFMSYTGKSISGKELQNEMNRIAHNTRKPEILKEIFKALGNDSHRIAECLARPVLVERLIESVYENNKNVQGKQSYEQWWTGQKDRYALNIEEAVYQYEEPEILFANCGTDSWTPTSTTNVPSGRVYFGSVWTGTEMIVWGGIGNGGLQNTGGRYNPVTDTWIATSTTGAPEARYGLAAVWTGTIMIVWGGSDLLNGVLASGGRYNPVSNTWQGTSVTNVPSARYLHSAVWAGSTMVIWGGEDTTPNYYNTGGQYDPVANSWTATNTTGAPQGRIAHTTVFTGTEMIVWGGMNGSGVLNTGGKYNPVGNTWTAVSTTNAPAARQSHSGVWTGKKMIVWGGFGADPYYDSGGQYDPASDSWVATSLTDAPMGRYTHSAVWTGDYMIVFGGISNRYLNSGSRYDPDMDVWYAITETNAPWARCEHTAVWTGTEMIIWAGNRGGTQYPTTGGRYTPAVPFWTATPATGAPTARQLPTAIWTGIEMIVWGGYDGGSMHYNSGALYNAVTDAWTPAATTNAPTARREHSAIWTGNSMIVWGGWNGSSVFGDGSKYSPVADSWSSISSSNSPAARYHQATVWTGTEMIVWGGAVSSIACTDTGGRYNPATDIWATVAKTGAPALRTDHTAIWSGTEMIVWGGWDFTTYYQSGGRYNPGTNSWTATSLISAPSNRRWHGAVWTGTHMLVWGGRDIINALNTGGSYDPLTDTWTAMSTTGAPVARTRATSLWDGASMIIWGGTSSGLYYNTGAKYLPLSDSWLTLITDNAPAGRQDHGSVIAENELIVWGGYPITDTGGRYCNVSCTIPAFGGIQSVNDDGPCKTGINITWQAASNFANGTYSVIRYAGASCTGPATILAKNLQSGVLQYTDTTAASGVTYYYQVIATNNCIPPASAAGTVSCSAGIVDEIPTPPAGVSNNTAADVDGCADSGVRITWVQDPSSWGDNNTGTRTYDVLRGTEVIASELAYGATNFVDTTGTNGVSYTYTVHYRNGCGFATITSPGATAADNLPGGPTSIPNNTAIDANFCAYGGIIITWAQDPTNWGDNGSGTRTYDVLRDGISVATGLAYGITSYLDTTALHDVVYLYTVRYNNGCSLSATTVPGIGAVDRAGSAPTGLVNNTAADASSCGDTGVTISWAANPDVWGDYGQGSRFYQVLRDGTPICTTPPGSCSTDTSGNNGQLYTYKVRYINGCGLYADTPGAQAMDWVDITPCPGIGNTLHALKSGTDIAITWTADSCTDLANYRVYGSTIYFAPFPAAWMPLGSPTTTAFGELLSSSYIAYKIISVDGCCNNSP